MCRNVRQWKGEASGSAAYVEPNHRRDYVLPESLKYIGPDDEKERFLLHDEPDSDNRIVIFGTLRGLEVLKRYTDWAIDGTFKSCPRQFFQSFSLHAIVERKTVPCLYILLPDKSEKNLYENV